MPATVTGRQYASAGTVNEHTAANAHNTVPTTITGLGSRSLAGSSGAARSGSGSVGIGFTVTDRRCA